MDETGDHYIKQNKSDSEKQMPYVFFHMWNLALKNKGRNRKGSEPAGRERGKGRVGGEDIIEVHCIHI
jgi:hypothetical protein